MTTIAWDGTILAADRQATGSYGLKRTVRKIYWSDSCVWGTVGELSQATRISEWLLAGADPEEVPTFDEPDFHALVVERLTLKAFLLTGRVPTFVPIEDDFTALGTGQDFALAAMACGKNAEVAVEVAHRFDANTGPSVTSVQIDMQGCISENGRIVAVPPKAASKARRKR